MEAHTKQERDQQITYQWGLEKADVMVTIFYGASRADAAQKMSYAVSHISVGPDVKLKGLGDEAYLWKSYGSDVGVINSERTMFILMLRLIRWRWLRTWQRN